MNEDSGNKLKSETAKARKPSSDLSSISTQNPERFWNWSMIATVIILTLGGMAAYIWLL